MKSFGKLTKLAERQLSWRYDAKAFVREAIGAEPTLQQIEALDALTNLVKAKWKHSIGAALTEEEGKLLPKQGISIMSGQGTGKDAFASWAILWFLFCFKRPVIPCTAPISHQLREVLWSEMGKWLSHRKADGSYACVIRDCFEIQNDKVYVKTGEKTEGKEWYAIARTADRNSPEEKQKETLQGFHEDNLMVVMDEASGIPDIVYQPLEGTLTRPVNLILILFNPTRTNGFAYQTHYSKEKKRWVCLQWNAEKSERVKPEHIRYMEEKYGRNSNTYRIRVLGLPPLIEEGSVVPRSWAERAQVEEMVVRDEKPCCIGVDCSGGGSDESPIVVRRGTQVTRIERFHHLNTSQMVSKILHFIEFEIPDVVMIDPIGVGWGVYNLVKESFKNTIGVSMNSTARNQRKFCMLRDELYWELRERLENRTLELPNNIDLIDQVSSPKYDTEKHSGKVKVESKRIMRSRGIGSPDLADALIMTFAIRDEAYGANPKDVERVKRYQLPRSNSVSSSSRSWITV